MYSGFSTSIGSIVGRVGGSSNLTELSDVIDSVGAEESLVCLDENNNDIHMSSMLNPQTGDLVWLPLEDSNFVKLKTMSMSQMSSMLRDDYRNSVYEAAIQKSIDSFRQHHNRNPIILDIGTGTGLLAMLCAKYGAEAVFAVEMFDLLAQTAQENVNRNGMGEKIMIIQGRSSDIEALPVPVDIIVSELLDSALLGECVIPSHADAIARFMDPASYEGPNSYPLENRVVPHSAEMYATLVQSTEVNRMVSIHNLLPSELPGSDKTTIFRENEYSPNCAGGWGLFPVHWRQIVSRSKQRQQLARTATTSAADAQSRPHFDTTPAKTLSEAVPCMHAEFWHTNPQLTHKDNSGYAMFDTEIEVKEAGIMHGILFHWKAHLLSPALDPGDSIVYSTDPAVLAEYPFQDHWKQCVFPLPNPMQVYRGQILQLRVCHDDLRVWAFVTVSPTSPPPPANNAINMGFCGGNTASVAGFSHHATPLAPPAADDGLESVLGKKRNRHAKEVKRSLSCMVSKEFQEAFAMPPCSCGWHLLNDNHTTSFWNDHAHRRHIQPLVLQSAEQIFLSFAQKYIDPVSGLLRLQVVTPETWTTIKASSVYTVVDDGDGSLVAIMVAQALKERLQSIVAQTEAFARAAGIALGTYILPQIRIVSVEKRQFSRMFYLHLVHANDLAGSDDETAINTDFVTVSVVESLTGGAAGEGEGMDDDNNDGAAASDDSAIVGDLVLSLASRRQSTLNALPLWQSLSFLYAARALTASHPSFATQILPSSAQIMMIPFQSAQLCRGHGPIHEPVRSLDHTAYDEQIAGIWSAFLYPYHAADYADMRYLAPQPVSVYSLDFTDPLNLRQQNYRKETTQLDLTTSLAQVRAQYGEQVAARIDGVIFFVQYHYTSSSGDVVVAPWNAWEHQFAPYEVQSVKFFASKYPVYDGGITQHGEEHGGHQGIQRLQVEVALDAASGETSDFEISFAFF